jgi:hypothetical protein
VARWMFADHSREHTARRQRCTVRKLCGLYQPHQAAAKAPVPEEAQAIFEAVADHFRPVGLGPGQEMCGDMEQGARRVEGTGGWTQGIQGGRCTILVSNRAA